MILCCGEALIDFMPVETVDGAPAFQPFNGGSIYNVAIALGRLGINVGFFGGLSKDLFGDMLASELAKSRVDASLAILGNKSTTLAFVEFSDGQPTYAFVDEGSAGRMINASPQLTDDINLLHFGSISLISDPAASVFENLAARENGHRLISIDPNIRPSLIDDVDTYRARLQRMFSFADIIKISDEDLEWLNSTQKPEDFAHAQLKSGASLVVVTRGKEGATAYTKAHKFEQAIEKIDIADTVGAGDAFMAGLLASLNEHKLLTREKLTNVEPTFLKIALEKASHVAAITVSRKGANPPWKSEL